jgi:hypothetical protein
MEVGKEDVFKAFKGLTLCWPQTWTQSAKLKVFDLENVLLPVGKINQICEKCMEISTVFMNMCTKCLWLFWGVQKKRSSITNAGLGLFAIKTIKIGFRLPYLGDIRFSADKTSSDYTLKLTNQLFIDAQDSKWNWSATKFINHNDNANCKFIVNHQTKQVFVETQVEIRANDELFVNYGPDFVIFDSTTAPNTC